MKDIEKLQRRIRWSEHIHLALMTLVLASSLILVFQSDDRLTQLLTALGTILPVQLICFVCERVPKKLPRLLLSLAVTALAVALTWGKERWSVYLICCVPILISGVFLPRSRGRILLTVPSLYSAVPLLVAYAFGRVVEAYGVPMIANIAVIITALATINYFIYISRCRLLQEFRFASDAEVSVTGMIRQNRRTVIAFLLVGVLILSVLPFLLRMETPEATPMGTVEESKSVISMDHYEEPDDKFYSESKGGTPLNLETAKNIMLGIVIMIPTVCFLASLLKGLQMVLGSIKRRKKGQPTKLADGMIIERLEGERTGRKREKLTGYERKLRRRYAKLIRSRVPENTKLAALTPTELERTAGLAGRSETDELHEIYERTRYSPASPDRETYRRFRELSKDI